LGGLGGLGPRAAWGREPAVRVSRGRSPHRPFSNRASKGARGASLSSPLLFLSAFSLRDSSPSSLSFASSPPVRLSLSFFGSRARCSGDGEAVVAARRASAATRCGGARSGSEGSLEPFQTRGGDSRATSRRRKRGATATATRCGGTRGPSLAEPATLPEARTIGGDIAPAAVSGGGKRGGLHGLTPGGASLLDSAQPTRAWAGGFGQWAGGLRPISEIGCPQLMHKKTDLKRCPTFELYEHRHHSIKNLKAIGPLLMPRGSFSSPGGASMGGFSLCNPNILSLSVLDFPTLMLSIPLMPLILNLFSRSPGSSSELGVHEGLHFLRELYFHGLAAGDVDRVVLLICLDSTLGPVVFLTVSSHNHGKELAYGLQELESTSLARAGVTWSNGFACVISADVMARTTNRRSSVLVLHDCQKPEPG
ncbi:hypothetical protein Taro_031451, partial [Colocasia esculenta]|nr:hypothetical protein [Colocasia esculenta]